MFSYTVVYDLYIWSYAYNASKTINTIETLVEEHTEEQKRKRKKSSVCEVVLQNMNDEAINAITSQSFSDECLGVSLFFVQDDETCRHSERIIEGCNKITNEFDTDNENGFRKEKMLGQLILEIKNNMTCCEHLEDVCIVHWNEEHQRPRNERNYLNIIKGPVSYE